ncbi:hypothetical protein SAMD00019534_039840 [Acytostelium subglobosum LB1]|uniref:hypothetical protein n=1 Tax=Acytostelium subglobosum LB1 TaxID=1410327 RepID=UPI000644AA80|nr:hypothetical protein SAMD00019534_039840 [Acytostelium subglobosum LB1]GAM20809.1 hypothetical protein SAMD00019534_039840 [Acytostelium subglobosum LB1]|eukprot:XP_012755943.1 hypothetical protein SAMD00019534_039840 [Acytostelium subglobosum LB1]
MSTNSRGQTKRGTERSPDNNNHNTTASGSGNNTRGLNNRTKRGTSSSSSPPSSTSSISQQQQSQWSISPNLLEPQQALRQQTPAPVPAPAPTQPPQPQPKPQPVLPVLITKESYKALMQKYQLDDDDDSLDDDDSCNEDSDDDTNNEDSVFEAYNKTAAGVALSSSSSSTSTIQQRESNVKRLIQETKREISSCLVCLERVRTADPVWQCSQCYCLLHLQCCQSWARERLLITSMSESCQQRGIQPFWCCPKCRNEYHRKDTPDHYKCFCGKSTNPPVDPWITPHSCGELCKKNLAPPCGHSCTLLCHPGACPPCPQTITARCHCDKEQRVQRCSSGARYECGQVCDARLECGHRCESNCHTGQHPPCKKTSTVACRCGVTSKEAQCAQTRHLCTNVCNKKLSCGQHQCKRVCCNGCEPCPLEAPRACGCGAQSFKLPCTKPTPSTCGATCNKVLACGEHRCYERCHTDACPNCKKVTTKTCRCGAISKEGPCQKELTCTTKCNNNRDCGKHKCRRKCCTGNCPPCEEECGERLSCGNHKCKSNCHRGRCLPCQFTVKLYCACKLTYIEVPCGTEKRAPVPKCTKLCQAPTTCHHSARRHHRCHFGPCQPCNKKCSAPLPNCKHKCPDPCHDPIPTVNYKTKPFIEYSSQTIHALIKDKPVVFPTALPLSQVQCKPCLVPQDRLCVGEHGAKTMKCSEDPVYSCDKQCGNRLECGNHSCTSQCHTINIRRKLQSNDGHSVVIVDDDDVDGEHEDTDDIEDSCEVCELPCQNDRPKGCTHKCDLPCHLNACPTCTKSVRKSCHCTSLTLYIPCNEYVMPEQVGRDIFSCGQVCRRFLPGCTHSCPNICHKGACAPCTGSLNVYCQCKLIKERWTCQQAQQRRKDKSIHNAQFDKLLACDENCMEVKRQQQKQMQANDAESETADGQTSNASLTKEQKRQRYQQKQMEMAQKWREEEAMRNKRSILDTIIQPHVIAKVFGVIILTAFIVFLVMATNRTK